MRRSIVLLAALLASASCEDITAADVPSTFVTLTPRAASAACVYADPEPAAVRQDRGVSFINESSVQITLVMKQNDVPLVSVAPGDTSRAVKFSDPGVYQYYSQGCGAGDLHTLSVTIN